MVGVRYCTANATALSANPKRIPSFLRPMPKISVLIHADTCKPELEKTIEQLSFVDDILIVASEECVEDVKKQLHHRARVQIAIPGVSPGAYAMDAFYDWIMVLRPGEELPQESVDRILEWKKRKSDEQPGYTLGIESDCLRLINRRKMNWTDDLPPASTVSESLPAAA